MHPASGEVASRLSEQAEKRETVPLGSERTYSARRYEFGTRVLQLRTRIALTQTGLAEQAGVHRRSVQNWETGASYPKAEVLQRLISVFVARRAFTPGSEYQEAAELWTCAMDGGFDPLAPFDHVWFDHILEQHNPKTTTACMPGDDETTQFASANQTLIDWGEALDAPELFGRDDELRTLEQWVVDDCCRVVSIVAMGGMGKSSLAMNAVRRFSQEFDLVLFRSLQNGPLPADVLDLLIRAVSEEQVAPLEQVSEKIAQLVQLFRERRCLLILDNFESILQPGEITGTYRSGYVEYGMLLKSLGERQHRSCLLLTSREKLTELGPLEGRSAPVRTLQLGGLPHTASQKILETKDVYGTVEEVQQLAELYGGNPLALMLAAEPIRELFGGDIASFLASGSSSFNGISELLDEQLTRSTEQEQTVLYELAIEREAVPVNRLLMALGTKLPQRDGMVALESLRRRLLIERIAGQSAFSLQPVILEFVTEQLVAHVVQEITIRCPHLLLSHPLVQATSKVYVRASQERLIATPVLERVLAAVGATEAVEHQLLALLDLWRGQGAIAQGYGPGNIVNLLRLLRGHLRGLDLARLSIRQSMLQGVQMQDTSLADAMLHETVFTETFDAILAVTVGMTGDCWAASTRHGEIRVWGAKDQNLRRVWRGHSDMIWALALSPDSNTLASGSWDGAVKLWDVESGALRWSGRHKSHVSRIVFRPDGRLLASSGDDACVRIWRAHTGALLQTLLHPKPVVAVAWSRSGRVIATGDVTGMIRLWQMEDDGSAACMRMFQGHSVWVNGMAFSPSDDALVSVSWDGAVKVWDVANGELRAALDGHTDRVLRVVWSRDARTIATSGRDKTIRLWDTESGKCRAVLHGHNAGAAGLALTPDDRYLLSGSEDGTLRVWDIAFGTCVRVMQGYAPSLYVVDWSPDGMQLVGGGTDSLVSIWDSARPSSPQILSGHRGVVCGVAWNPDARRVASSEWDNTIRVWDVSSGACLRILQHPEDSGNCFYDLSWSPDGGRLASGTNRHGVQVFEVVGGTHDWAGQHFPTIIRHVAWNPNGLWLAGAGDDGNLYLWNPDDENASQCLTGHHGAVKSLAWSPSGTLLASGGGSQAGELFVWDVQRGERVHTGFDHPEKVFAVAWGRDDTIAISGDGNGMLRCWNVAHGTTLWVREAHQGTIQSLRRSPNGAQVASCGDDGAIRVWDVSTGQQIEMLRRDRPYERMNITGLNGVSPIQRASLLALGAVDFREER